MAAGYQLCSAPWLVGMLNTLRECKSLFSRLTGDTEVIGVAPTYRLPAIQSSLVISFHAFRLGPSAELD